VFSPIKKNFFNVDFLNRLLISQFRQDFILLLLEEFFQFSLPFSFPVVPTLNLGVPPFYFLVFGEQRARGFDCFGFTFFNNRFILFLSQGDFHQHSRNHEYFSLVIGERFLARHFPPFIFGKGPVRHGGGSELIFFVFSDR